jgi:hypothetical protein
MISLRSRYKKTEEVTLVDRMRSARGRSRYWLFVVALAAVGALVLVIAPPRRPGLVPAEPAGKAPETRVLETKALPLGSVERLSIRALVEPGLPDSLLRRALDRLLYVTLDSANRRARGRVRVVWAYLVEGESAGVMDWRAMAIWTDSTLAKSLRPAGIGGDALEERGTEYDFTNPVRPGPGPGPAGK